VAYAELGPGEQARVQAELRPLIRRNTFDAASGQIVVPAERAQAIAQVAAHYSSLFSNDPATHALREGYAMREDTVPMRSTVARSARSSSGPVGRQSPSGPARR
jgi:nitric oxide reductase subunit B